MNPGARDLTGAARGAQPSPQDPARPRGGAERARAAERAPPPPATRPSVLDVHQDFIRDLLGRFPDITARRVYEELCARVEPVFAGRYTIVKALVRKLRPKPVVELSTPMAEPEPGKVAECDWATILLDFKNGTRHKLQIFGYTLAYSHRRYYRFYDRADFHALLDGHVEAFDHLDGLAAACKYDGQKTVVLRWRAPSPSTIRASWHSRRTIDFDHGRADRVTRTTSLMSS